MITKILSDLLLCVDIALFLFFIVFIVYLIANRKNISFTNLYKLNNKSSKEFILFSFYINSRKNIQIITTFFNIEIRWYKD